MRTLTGQRVNRRPPRQMTSFLSGIKTSVVFSGEVEGTGVAFILGLRRTPSREALTTLRSMILAFAARGSASPRLCIAASALRIVESTGGRSLFLFALQVHIPEPVSPERFRSPHEIGNLYRFVV